MVNEISKKTRKELTEAIKHRYLKSSKKEKTRILDEFIHLSGYHRKHALRLFNNQHDEKVEANKIKPSLRIYDEAVKEALIIIWETADRICSKRLKAIMPDLIRAMERHGHLKLDSTVGQRLLKISAATIDRLLFDVRRKAHPYKYKRKAKKKVSKQLPIRTFADWGDPEPGYLEIDFVAHSGGSMSGAFIHTLVATDVCSGWIECIPLLAREQYLVVEALEVFRAQLPIPLLGIDSDNDSAFINETLLSYCRNNGIEFTRSRPFRKNDQAWVEQKNGAVVRRFVGYKRFSGVVAGQALAHLYQNVRLYVNYFQPSFKLLEKERQGGQVKKRYGIPVTPYNRLLQHPSIDSSVKKELKILKDRLDPVRLLHQIRDKQGALAALSTADYSTDGPGKLSLAEFLSQLPILWRHGDARPTHERKKSKKHYWRTRPDPFKEVWPEVLYWLQSEPDKTAKDLFKRLQGKYPGRFADGQLRTLQRRVKDWRQIMAKKLVYSYSEINTEYDKIVPIGAGK